MRRGPTDLLFILLFLGILNPTIADYPSSMVDLDILSEVNSEFSVKIEVVGEGAYHDKKIIPHDNNVYDVYSDQPLSLLSITAKFSGYTNWNLGRISVPKVIPVMDLGNSTTTIGQYFLMIDDEVRILTDYKIAEGISLSLTLGDHVVTVMYIGKDGILGTVYDYESIVIRVRADGDDFEDYNLVEIPADLQIVDTFEEGIVSAEVITEYGKGMYRNNAFEPTASTVSFKIDNVDKENYDIVILPTNEEHNISASFIVNSTGFDGIQMLGEWEGIKGLTFFVDALGLHKEMPDSVTIHNGLNYIGVYTFAPFGLWHKDLLYGTDSISKENQTNGKVDWDGTAGNLGYGLYGFYGLNFDSSFDFLGVSSGIIVDAGVGVLEVNTIDDAPYPLALLPIAVLVILKKRMVKK